MVGKLVQFDEETWEVIEAVARKTGNSFQEPTSTAFADLLKKHHQPISFKAALQASVKPQARSRKRKDADGLLGYELLSRLIELLAVVTDPGNQLPGLLRA